MISISSRLEGPTPRSWSVIPVSEQAMHNPLPIAHRAFPFTTTAAASFLQTPRSTASHSPPAPPAPGGLAAPAVHISRAFELKILPLTRVPPIFRLYRNSGGASYKKHPSYAPPDFGQAPQTTEQEQLTMLSYKEATHAGNMRHPERKTSSLHPDLPQDPSLGPRGQALLPPSAWQGGLQEKAAANQCLLLPVTVLCEPIGFLRPFESPRHSRDSRRSP
jgi:hypothetical protein